MCCQLWTQGALEPMCPFDLLPVAPVTVNGRPQRAYQARIHEIVFQCWVAFHFPGLQL